MISTNKKNVKVRLVLLLVQERHQNVRIVQTFKEQLLALTNKEKAESQYDDEIVRASRAKILQRTTEESQGTERQESWQKMTGRTIVSGNGLRNQLLVVFVIQM